MLIIMRQGYFYLYKLNFTVELRIEIEHIRNGVIRCFHFTDEETEDQRSEISFSR